MIFDIEGHSIIKAPQCAPKEGRESVGRPSVGISYENITNETSLFEGTQRPATIPTNDRHIQQ